MEILEKLKGGPHIVDLISSGETVNHGFILVFPYMETDLYGLIHDEQKMSMEQIRATTEMILSGVDYMHSKQIVHLDLKPNNILVGKNGIVSICDFGLSNELINGRKYDAICGTREYMCPEMLLGYGCDKGADIWVNKFTLIFYFTFLFHIQN